MGSELPPSSGRIIPTTTEVEIYPHAPREQELVSKFKKIIVQHLEDVGDKTTEEFLDGITLDLWRASRGR